MALGSDLIFIICDNFVTIPNISNGWFVPLLSLPLHPPIQKKIIHPLMTL